MRAAIKFKRRKKREIKDSQAMHDKKIPCKAAMFNVAFNIIILFYKQFSHWLSHFYSDLAKFKSSYLISFEMYRV